MSRKLRLHRRNRLPLALAIASLLSLLWIWQVTLPLLDEQTAALQNRRAELNQRKQAAAAQTYQPLIARLQNPVPAPAVIIASLKKQSAALELPDTAYTLTQPQPLDHNNLSFRRLSISLPKAQPAVALTLWQELRHALPCEVRLSTFTSDGPAARLELELIGSGS